jgi:hypothetical protein
MLFFIVVKQTDDEPEVLPDSLPENEGESQEEGGGFK